MDAIREFEQSLIAGKEFPKFGPGDTVRVHLKIVEGNKERVQVYQGVVIGINNRGSRTTFNVRKVCQGGYGVERILPLYTPAIDHIEVVRHGHVRRAKLYFLRNRIGKSARIREKRSF